MSSSDRTPTFYSYSLTGMDGFNSVTKLERGPQGGPPQDQYVYLQIKTDQGQPLPPTLFTKDVIEGMVAMQGQMVCQEQEPPSEVMLLSDAEAVVEFSKSQHRKDHGLDESSPVLVGPEGTSSLQVSHT